jgi:glycosyltransferase involved in cell wall biosynthesis
MRVALVHWTLPPTVGGVETHLVDLANSYAHMGVDVVIVSGEHLPSTEAFADRVTFFYHDGLQYPLRSPTRPGSLGKLLVGLKVQIVHAHNILPLDAHLLPEFRLAKEAGRLLLFHTSHSEWPEIQWPEDRSLWDGMFAVSTYLKDQLQDLGVPTKVTCLPVNSQTFRTEVAPFEGPDVSLLHPSRLVEEKGCSLSLTLLEFLLGEGVKASLTMMETPQVFDISLQATAYADEIRRRIARSGLSSRVKLMAASVKDMPKIYESSDIVLCPSIFPEPYGLAALEAMSCGRPVIASAVGGMRANIRHGETGLLFEPGQVHDLHILAKDLIDKPDFARALGRNARKYVVRHRSVYHFAKKMLEIYTSTKEEVLPRSHV